MIAVPRHLRCSLALLAHGLLFGCLGDLPDETLIEEERLLAVRARPLLSTAEQPDRSEFSVQDEVLLEALLVDPDGLVPEAAAEARWFACPLARGTPAADCLLHVTPIDSAAVEACPQPLPDTVPAPFPSLCHIGDGRTAPWTVPAYEQAAAGLSLGLLLVLAVDASVSVDACSEALLSGDADPPDTCLFGAYGLDIRPAPSNAEQAPNLHPTFEHVLVRRRRGTDVVEEQRVVTGQTLTMAADETLELVAVPSKDAAQQYLVPHNGGTSFTTTTEPLAVAWYRTAGAFEDDPLEGFAGGSFDQRWEPGETSSGPAAPRIYAVLRDGRGGLTWWWTDIEVGAP